MEYAINSRASIASIAFALSVSGFALFFIVLSPTVDAATPGNSIDTLVLDAFTAANEPLPETVSDATFIRRIYLDLTGTLPRLEETRAFLANSSPSKRSELASSLLESPDFVDYWTLKWCDLLRVKSEYPINLWPNGVQAYHKWIRTCIAQNMSYSTFAEELLTSSGSNYRVPAANFYRAVQEPTAHSIAAAVSLTFLGSRIEKWPEQSRDDLAAFFTRVRFKKTAEWKEEIVFLDTTHQQSINTRFPNNEPVTIPFQSDPRKVLTNWILSDGGSPFAKAAVNRIWFWLMGHGIAHPADDLGPHNPPANPELLEFLAERFVASGYNRKAIISLITDSKTYQRSAAREGHSKPLSYARYSIRPLEAEVLADAINQLTDASDHYSSPIPEPFTFIPESQRTIAIADGSITSQFLETFGRPSRDTGRLDERNANPSDSQRLYLLNSTELQNKLLGSPALRQVARGSRAQPARAIRQIYLSLLSRQPNANELRVATDYLENRAISPRHATLDIAWALINSKEFLYKH